MSKDPETMLRSYVKAYESLDPNAVVPFYLLPCTFIRPDGVWVVSDDETALTLAAHMIDHARHQGYAHTEVSTPAVRPLAANLAELTGVFIRYDSTNAEIGRFGFSYVVKRDEEDWKIIVAIAHDAPAQ